MSKEITNNKQIFLDIPFNLYEEILVYKRYYQTVDDFIRESVYKNIDSLFTEVLDNAFDSEVINE